MSLPKKHLLRGNPFVMVDRPNTVDKFDKLLAAFAERQGKLYAALQSGKSGLGEAEAAEMMLQIKKQMIAAKILQEGCCTIVLAEIARSRYDIGMRHME